MPAGQWSSSEEECDASGAGQGGAESAESEPEQDGMATRTDETLTDEPELASAGQSNINKVSCEFDDSAYHVSKERCARIKTDLLRRVATEGVKLFSFTELAEAQAELKVEAATAPHSCVPLAVVTSLEELPRLVLLSLINVVYAWRLLPSAWALTPVVPHLKPGKPKGDIKGYRQVSLLESVFKLYDKLLQQRVTLKIRERLRSWRTGGL